MKVAISVDIPGVRWYNTATMGVVFSETRCIHSFFASKAMELWLFAAKSTEIGVF